jgi:tetratricopeptide (TPR) repeat protein
MTHDADNEPPKVRAEGDGATAINAGAGADVRVDNRIGVSIRDSQTGDITINLPLPLTGLAALHQLRAPVADFVGREREVAELLEALAGGAAAISGVVGLGGIGKTELAMVVANQVRDRFPDAQLVLELQGSREPSLSAEEALRRVIRAFHPDAKLPDDAAQIAALYRSVLADKRVLIIADDACDAAQVRPLLPPPGSALLVTSRQRFTLPKMRCVDLERLSEGEAVTLLRAVCERLSAEEAAQIAAACGGLPLALRMAGGLLAADETMSVPRYLQRLADERRRLAALHDDSAPDLDVDASLALSYALLDATAQSDLRMLGVFGASFDLAAAGAVLAEDDEEVVEARLSALYRRCLLEFTPERRRYELHELVHAFALGRLGDEERAARLRHARHYITVADRADDLYLAGGENVAAGLALFDQERAGLDTARRWLQAGTGDTEVDTLLIADAGATVYIGSLRYDWRHERIPQLETALEAARRLGRRSAEGAFLGNLGLAYDSLSDYARTIEHCQQHLVIAQELGDRRGEGTALGNLGIAYASLGDCPRAIEHHQQCLAIAREIGDLHGESAALGNLGNVYASFGDYSRAIDFYQQHLTIAREIGDRQGEGRALGNLGAAYHSLGDYPRAIEHQQQRLTIAREIGDRQGEGQALGNLGNVYHSLGDYPRAIDFYQQLLTIAREIGDRQGEANSSWNLGGTLAKQGDPAQALPYLEAALAFYQAINHPRAEEDSRLVEQVRQHAAESQRPSPDSLWRRLRRLLGG